MATKDARFMQDKQISLCPLCQHSIYDAINENGWNCKNRNSNHYTHEWDLHIDDIVMCDVFSFAYPGLKGVIEKQLKREDAKKQTSLLEF